MARQTFFFAVCPAVCPSCIFRHFSISLAIVHMTSIRKNEAFILFCGDVILFVFSLWLSLLARYGKVPAFSLFKTHLIPFSILFIVWLLIFFISGLYEKHTLILKQKLPS